MDNISKYYHAFNLVTYLGSLGFKKLLKYFKSIEVAWSASSSDLIHAGLSASVADKIIKKRSLLDLEAEYQRLINENITLISWHNENYPKLLKEIYDPPALLYVKGKLADSDQQSIGIVGTRRLTNYGRQITPALTAELALAGLTIVSGLALGIDTLAHTSALESGARTIAVLGSGLNDRVLYPQQNRQLAHKIMQQGAVISEFPPYAVTQSYYFPLRNRIISGLSLGVLVVEAPQRSGALITARQALDQNRDVFAVPGPIYAANSEGCNNLIKMGAKPVTTGQDIIEELNINTDINHKKDINFTPGNASEAKILKCLSKDPVHIDKIIFTTKLSPSTASALLTMLQVKNIVKNLGGQNYIINN